MTSTAAAADMLDGIRSISDDEIAFFHQNGWVHLPRLIPPALASELLAHAQTLMGIEAAAVTGGGGGDPAFAKYRDILRNHLGAWQHDRLMYDLSHAPQLGRLASRLLHGKPVRFLNDEILVKLPAAQNSKPTPWHQDFPHAAYDRSSMVNIWIALVELPPERGAMRFLSGSHRAGPIGRTLLDDHDALEQFPWLAEQYPMSPPLHLQPGDATIHGDLTLHGGPANTSDAARWAYLVNLFDATARFTGARVYGAPIEGIPVDGLYDSPRYPVVAEAAV